MVYQILGIERFEGISKKTGKTYDATVLLADMGGKYVNYRIATDSIM